jgi:eukaryotic-like serine/threonine-protein kinase
MTPAEPDDTEDTFTALLAAADEALASGRPLPAGGPADQPRLERALACVRLLRAAGPSADDTAEHVPLQVGRFHIRRELGRGGFGIVLLAEDPTVNREVALKIPRADALVTPALRERFQREARAAASLDHPNIVPVYEAGEVGPISYIASAYCPGPTLAECLRGRTQPVPFADAARFIAQLAGAVQHAHGRNVLHRDLKPANILLHDGGLSSQEWESTQRGSSVSGPTAGADSTLISPQTGLPSPRITDFGLAKLLDASESKTIEPTRSGTVLGTPSYMAPEQAESRGLSVGPAADIYALGAILYELLTGRPPFRGETELDTLLQVRTIDAVAPSRLRPQTPRDLETICLKCLAKEPTRRYESAGDLADDLSRWLANEPIRARPPSAVYRLRKFSRRNRTALAMAALILFALVLLGGGAGWAVRDRTARQMAFDREITRALEEAEAAYERDQLPEAMAAVQRAEGLLATGHGRPETARHVEEWRRDLDMLARLEAIRFEQASANVDRMANEEADRRYAQAFADYGVDVANLPVPEAASRMQGRRINVGLAGVLDGWAATRRHAGQPEDRWQPLLTLASECDPDPWRVRVRNALARPDRSALMQLAVSDQVRDLPPRTLSTLGNTLRAVGAVKEAVALLRSAQRQYPQDFWINYALGWCLTELRPAQNEQAVRFYSAAIALRGDLPSLHHNLGVALVEMNQFDEAELSFGTAIRLKPEYAGPHNGLGVVHAKRSRHDEAIRAFDEAIHIKPDWYEPHINRGLALTSKGQKEEGIASIRRAVKLAPDNATTHYALGSALWRSDLVDEAIAACREAIRRRDNFAPAHSLLGLALASQGHVAEAIAELDRAVRLQPSLPAANVNLAVLLANGPDPARREVSLAMEPARRAAADRQYRWVLGVVYYRAEMWSAAEQVLEESQKSGHINNRGRFFLAMSQWQLGRHEPARRLYDQVCRDLDKNPASLQGNKDKAAREELRLLRREAAQLMGLAAD